MAWLQLHTVTDRAGAPALEDAMLEAGAVSVTLTDHEDQPILEPGVGETPLWSRVNVTALFHEGVSRAGILKQLGLPEGGCRWEVLEDRQWERTWMDQFEPIPCGDRLWICPSWQAPPRPEAINLILDPGLAFGSGTHPTTFLCLQWLDRQDLDGKTVIDYGCGSGILGIAALLLGAGRVIAIDNDPQALTATRENLRRNGLDPGRLETCPPDEVPDIHADILVANILAGPLIELADTFCGLLADGGNLVLSGIMSHQAGAVKAAYPRIDFVSASTDEDWARLDGVKKS